MEKHAWMLLMVLAAAALAGCLENDKPGGNETMDDGTDVEEEPPEPRTQDLSCSSQPGTGAVTVNGIGGCQMGSASFDAIAIAVDPASGCSVTYDENSDDMADGTIEQGDVVSQGWDLVVFCDAGAAGDHSVTLEEQL